MTLRSIVQALGGELYDGGRRANIPAPGHSAEDRSVSLLLQDDRVVVHTFGDGDWKGVLDFLRDQHLIDASNAPLDGPASPFRAKAARPAASDTERRDAALRLWEPGRAVVGTVAERHCRLRGVRRALPGPSALRHNSEAAVSAYAAGKHRRPALLAGIQDADDRFTAVEVTYLAPNGQRALDLRLSRKTVGPSPAGCAVRLDPAGPEMLVAEGVFTTLSATEWFGLPGWALMSTRNLRAWTPPAGVRAVLIAADRGKDGEASAERLKGRLLDLGLAASVALPPAPWGDWNEWSCRP
ncbi:MAG: toprim domain-containing protein [Phenylobacterium sp.]|nr:toprim domain-containing protein [Phenylobacterium sp.]